MIKLNPNKLHVKEVREALKENDNYCPCQIKSDDSKCICKNFREEVKEGYCICELYYKEKDE